MLGATVYHGSVDVAQQFWCFLPGIDHHQVGIVCLVTAMCFGQPRCRTVRVLIFNITGSRKPEMMLSELVVRVKLTGDLIRGNK